VFSDDSNDGKFFTKSKTKAKATIVYGFSLLLFMFFWVLVTWIFADALNALSTNVWFNIIFFVLLVVLRLHSWVHLKLCCLIWANKVDSQADRGGIIGILFMALALAIVSLSCTGPIVGTLLVEAA
jgi:thiol:disulfide interchange protein DsbD